METKHKAEHHFDFLLHPESTNMDDEAKCYRADVSLCMICTRHVCACLKLRWYKMHDQRRELLTELLSRGSSALFRWTTEGGGSLETWRDAVMSAPPGFTGLRCVRPDSVKHEMFHFHAWPFYPRLSSDVGTFVIMFAHFYFPELHIRTQRTPQAWEKHPKLS